MDTRVWRKRINGWGLLLAGGAATGYSVSQWGTDAPVMIVLFGVVALSGAFTIGGRENVHFYLLPIMGVLAFLKAIGYYLNYGMTMVTLAFVIFGIVSVAKGVQAYRTLQRGTEA